MRCRPWSRSLFHMRHQTSTLLTRAARRHLSKHSVGHKSISDILDLLPAVNDSEPLRIDATGHVRTVRNQRHMSFVELGDGSTSRSLQAILDPPQAENLGTGTAVRLSGVWRSSPSGKEQSHELHVEDVQVLGPANPETYPIQKKFHRAEYLRTIPHLRLRTPFNALLARLRSECDFQAAIFFKDRQFVRTQPPIITSSDCEGAGEVFTVSAKDVQDSPYEKSESAENTSINQVDSFFRTPKYLTVSSQLHLEAFVHEHQKVWTLSPTFRAEKSDTPRHLSEFYMLEAELRTESLQDVMDVVENLIQSLTISLRKSNIGRELLGMKHVTEPNQEKFMTNRTDMLRRRWQGLERQLWPRIPYDKAIGILQDAVKNDIVSFRYQPAWKSGLHLEHERFLAAELGQGSPVFITDYPAVVKPFYMLPSNIDDGIVPTDSSTVACFDLLFPEAGEVVGGSLREHRLEALLISMQRHGLRKQALDAASEKPTPDSPVEANGLDWYVDLRRFGSVPHGGFGLGFDRLLGYLAGVDSIRDVAPWPRYHGRCIC